MNLLRYLDFFVAIAEELHFGAAARRLGITQPPLSQGLQRLENELGVRLIERNSRGVAVTEAGVELLPLARALLFDVQQLRACAGQHGRNHTVVRFGATEQIPPSLLAALAVTYGAVGPGGVSVRTAPTTSLIESVAKGHLDVAVIHHPAVIGDLHATDVVALRTCLLLPAHAALSMDPPRLRDLIRWPVLTSARVHNPPAYDLLTETLADLGVQTGVAVVEDERTALALVAAGQGCLITADRMLGATGVARVALPGGVLPLRVRAITHPGASPHLPIGLAETAVAVLRGTPTAQEQAR